MASYSLSPAGFGKVKSRLIMTFAVMYPFALAVALIAAYRTNPELPPWIIIILVLLTGGALAIGARWGLKTQQGAWHSYRLTIDKGSVSRTQSRVPYIEISCADIMSIVETAHGLTVKSNDKRKFIFIPASLVNYEAAREELHAIKPVSAEAK